MKKEVVREYYNGRRKELKYNSKETKRERRREKSE